MNLVLVFERDRIHGDRFRVSGRRQQHIRKVIRPRLGDTVTVGLLNQEVGEGTVVAMGDREVELEVLWEGPPPAALPVTLMMALPRPKFLFKSLQLAATMGVKDIHLFNSSRVDKSFWQSGKLAQDAMHQHLLLGLEQAKDTVLPTVQLHRLFAPLMNDHLPSLIEGRRCLLAHPAPDSHPCPRALTEPTVLALGPERGLIDYEVASFQARGFEVIGLGRRILRTEQALAVLLGRMFD